MLPPMVEKARRLRLPCGRKVFEADARRLGHGKRQVGDGDRIPRPGEPCKRPHAAEFDIVWMRADSQDVHRDVAPDGSSEHPFRLSDGAPCPAAGRFCLRNVSRWLSFRWRLLRQSGPWT